MTENDDEDRNNNTMQTNNKENREIKQKWNTQAPENTC